MSSTEEYHAWCQMIQRCTNPRSPAWKDYGGRGITVCPEWRESFEVFYKHVGPKPGKGRKWSLGRIDNDDGYRPGNVEWQTRSQQSKNRRPDQKVQKTRSRKDAWFWRGQWRARDPKEKK